MAIKNKEPIPAITHKSLGKQVDVCMFLFSNQVGDKQMRLSYSGFLI